MIVEIPILKMNQKLNDIVVTESILIAIADKFYYNKQEIFCENNEHKRIGKVVDIKIDDNYMYCVTELPKVTDKKEITKKQIKSSIELNVELKKITIQ